MKKEYSVPKMTIVRLRAKATFLSVSQTGEDLDSRSYGSKDGEDTNNFWK